MKMTGSFNKFKCKCEYRQDYIENRTSSGGRFSDKCGIYRSIKECNLKNCPLCGGDNIGH